MSDDDRTPIRDVPSSLRPPFPKPIRWRSEDLKGPLPAKVAIDLCVALESLQDGLDDRLLLRHPPHQRAPTWNRSLDYNVFWRGEIVGLIHFYKPRERDYPGRPWYWSITNLPWREWTSGHTASLQEAKAEFRKAWDEEPPGAFVKVEPGQASKG